MEHDQRRANLIVLSLAGITFGVLTSAVNHGFGPAAPYTSKLLGNDWAWLTVSFIAIWRGRSWKEATRRGTTFLLSAVLAYYVTDVWAGTYETSGVDSPFGAASVDASGLVSDAIFYLVLGTLTAAALGFLVVLVHRGGSVGLLAALVLPGYISYKALGLRAVASYDPTLQEVSGFVGLVALIATILILLTGTWRLTRSDGSSGLREQL